MTGIITDEWHKVMQFVNKRFGFFSFS